MSVVWRVLETASLDRGDFFAFPVGCSCFSLPSPKHYRVEQFWRTCGANPCLEGRRTVLKGRYSLSFRRRWLPVALSH